MSTETNNEIIDTVKSFIFTCSENLKEFQDNIETEKSVFDNEKADDGLLDTWENVLQVVNEAIENTTDYFVVDVEDSEESEE